MTTTVPSPSAGTTPAVRTRPATAGLPLGHVVLVHGTLDASASFRRVVDRLASWELTTYDRRGWGQSAALGPAGLNEHAQDLADLLPATLSSILVGHSFGATVALTVAATVPDRVRAVVAYEPPLPWLPWWPDRAPWEQLVLDDGRPPGDAAEALLRGVIGDDAWSRLPERIRAQRRGEGEALVAEMSALGDASPSFDPLAIGCAVITAAGSASLPHHQLVSERLAELLPVGQYHEIAGAEHHGHVTHPDQFAALVGVAAELVVPAAP